MLDQIIQQDQQLFLFLNGLGTSSWDGFWMFITGKWSAIPLYALLLFFAYKQYSLKQLLFFLIGVALLITMTDQLANFFKYGVARLRPCHDETLSAMVRLVKSSCGGQYGYFSAHAASSMALAVYIAITFTFTYKYLKLFLVVWAIAVGFSRIYIGVHYPLDVLTGFTFGSLLAWICAKLFLRTILKS